MDEEFYCASRKHILDFLRTLPLEDGSLRILEIGPKLEWPTFETLDVDAGNHPTHVADITRHTGLPDSHYDLILCISVLEHVLDPVGALAEIRRLLKPGGLLAAQTPLNFRIHGPANDCWRFTEHGIKVLMKDWDELNISILESHSRPLFPIAYAWTARANKEKSIPLESVAKTFRWIE